MTYVGRGKAATEDRLVKAAVELFANKWYGTVSVAEICRRAELSNGVFYRYYDGKEALFKVILGQVLDQIRENIHSVSGATKRERLSNLASVILRFSAEHSDLVSVFREGQYRFFEYERRLVEIYIRGLAEALGEPRTHEVGLSEYLYALGGLRFCATRRTFNGSPVEESAVVDILEKGIFRGQDFDAAKVFGGSATPLPLPLEEGARDRLLRAGKRLFGEKGYFEANIHEITDGAELSVGAFYTYFQSKEGFYAELIARTGHDLRAFISRNLDPPGGKASELNALEYEMRGLWLWLVYLSIDKHCYNIVREAEFVLPEAVRDYYAAFIRGYERRPEAVSVTSAAPGLDRETAIEFLLGIAHYFGLEVAFDESPGNARSLVETIGVYLSRGLSDWLD